MFHKLSIQVVVPVLNDRKRLNSCVLSLSKQIEVARIVVVDNGSMTDLLNWLDRLKCETIVQKGLKVVLYAIAASSCVPASTSYSSIRITK